MQSVVLLSVSIDVMQLPMKGNSYTIFSRGFNFRNQSVFKVFDFLGRTFCSYDLH